MQKDNSNVSKKESPLFQPKCQINFWIFLDQNHVVVIEAASDRNRPLKKSRQGSWSVVTLHADMQAHSFAHVLQREVAPNGHIRHDVSRPDEEISPHRTEGANGRISECINIEVLADLSQRGRFERRSGFAQGTIAAL